MFQQTRRGLWKGWVGVAVLMAGAVSPGVMAAKPMAIGDIDLLDQQAVAVIQGGVRGGKGNGPATLQAIDAAIERQTRGALGSWFAGGTAREKLAGIYVGAQLRQALGNASLTTEITSLRDNTGCAVDLALDRHLARYTRAVAHADEAEQLLVLLELQNGLNCLSARQATFYANALGAALSAWDVLLDESGLGGDRVRHLRGLFLNPAMLVADATKGLTTTSTYLWLYAMRQELADSVRNADATIYLYDFYSANLVEIADRAMLAANLGELLDPRNIGMGMCSFMEMFQGGSATGAFSCGRGLGCGGQASSPVDPYKGNALASNKNMLESGLNARQYAGVNLAGGGKDASALTPLGIPVGSLTDNCDGVGGGKGGDGGNPLSPNGQPSFAGCVAGALIAGARENDYGYCMVKAAANAGPMFDDEIVIGARDPKTGRPIIKGIHGNEECSTDPRTDGGGRDDPFGVKKALRETSLNWAKDIARMMLEAHPEFGETLADNLIDEWESAGLGRPKTADAKRREVENGYFDIDAEMESAIDGAEDDDLSGDYGEYRDKDNKIVVDVEENANTGTTGETILHELGHFVADLVGTDGLSTDQEHAAYEKTMRDLGLGWYLDWVAAEEAEHRKEEAGDDKTTSGDDGTEMPGSPNGPDSNSCTAMSETMKAFINCQAFSQASGWKGGRSGGLGPRPAEHYFSGLTGAGGGAVDPSYEQWIQGKSNPLQQCMDKHGMGVAAVDGNDIYVINAKSPSNAGNCSAKILCPADTAAASVGGSCRCTKPTGVVLRDLGAKKLCQSSDACFDRPVVADEWVIRR